MGKMFDVTRDVDHTVPDGRYNGVYHGYQITFKVNDNEYTAKTDTGNRGWIDCVVIAKDGECIFEI